MKTVITCFMFASSSDPSKLYDTLLYVDNSTSCPCPGWTRRVQADGSRSCKHTRLICAGLAERYAVKVVQYGGRRQPTPPPLPLVKAGRRRGSQTPDEATARKFDFSL